MANETQFNLQVSMQRIETKTFSVSKPESMKEKPEKLSIGFSTNVEFDRKNDLVIFPLSIIVYELNNQSNEFCRMELIFFYNVIGLKKLKFEKGKIAIPDPFMEIITSISLSTARGILYEKLADTFLKGFILPIVDAKNLVPKPRES